MRGNCSFIAENSDSDACGCFVAKSCLTFVTPWTIAQVELFQILKDDAVKVLHSVCQ